MLRLLVLASVCAVINARAIPSDLEHLFGTKREVVEEKGNEREKCKTKESQIIKESIDESLDPSDDVYEYASGHFKDTSLWTTVSKKVKSQIKTAIEKRGAEPILSMEWNEDIYNWQIVNDQYARLFGFNSFYDLCSGKITYDGNEIILIETPHLPCGVHKFLPDKDVALDSSDENNESGEGSQEKSSKERSLRHSNEESEGEEENENAIEDYEEIKLQKKTRTSAKHQKRLGHCGRRYNKKRVTHKHVGKVTTRKRTKRDALKQKILRKSMHKLEKANKLKVHHAKGKLSKHRHLVHNKLSTRRNNMKHTTSHKRRHAKVHRNNNKRNNTDETKLEKEEELRKKKAVRRGNAKRLGHVRGRNYKSKALEKYAHKKNTKKKSNRTRMEATGHAAKHHKHQKMTNHRVHNAAKSMGTSKRENENEIGSSIYENYNYYNDCNESDENDEDNEDSDENDEIDGATDDEEDYKNNDEQDEEQSEDEDEDEDEEESVDEDEDEEESEDEDEGEDEEESVDEDEDEEESEDEDEGEDEEESEDEAEGEDEEESVDEDEDEEESVDEDEGENEEESEDEDEDKDEAENENKDITALFSVRYVYMIISFYFYYKIFSEIVDLNHIILHSIYSFFKLISDFKISRNAIVAYVEDFKDISTIKALYCPSDNLNQINMFR